MFMRAFPYFNDDPFFIFNSFIDFLTWQMIYILMKSAFIATLIQINSIANCRLNESLLIYIFKILQTQTNNYLIFIELTFQKIIIYCILNFPSLFKSITASNIINSLNMVLTQLCQSSE